MKIELQGADNIRDFTGIKNSQGKTIVSPAFIRSNLLSSINESDISILKEKYKLKKIIDLRTKMEAYEKPDIEIEGVEYRNIPLFKESAIGLTHEENTDGCVIKDGDMLDMKALYVRLVSDEYSIRQLSKVMRLIINHIGDSNGGAILWHCTEGKDRCGIVSVLFLSMLGVDMKIIMQDYLETNKAALKRAQLFYKEILKTTNSVERAEKGRRAFLASEDYLNAALESICHSYATVQEFIIQRLNISETEIKKLRNMCLA